MMFRTLVKLLALILCIGLPVSCGKTPEQQATQQPGDSARSAPAPQPVGAANNPPPLPVEQATQPGGGKPVPIDIKLPKPMFVGTPTNIAVENLEKPLGRPRPPFLAPEGTRNVALGKPVSSSDDQPIIGELEMITDGDKEAAEGSYVEIGPRLQHVTIDLKAEHTIYAVVVWHYHKQPVAYNDVIIQVAGDEDFVSGVHTIFNNDIDNSSGQGVGKDMTYIETAEGRLVDAKGVIGRYVRLYSRGNTANELNHYIEVEVYGKPAK